MFKVTRLNPITCLNVYLFLCEFQLIIFQGLLQQVHKKGELIRGKFEIKIVNSSIFF